MSEESEALCRNCGAALSGEFCAACGQREGRGDRYFGELLSELLGDVFTWDSRVWRTFYPLLFKPGFLSAEFNVGRRARYMPPFRLYLVISFVTFFSLSLTTGGQQLVKDFEQSTASDYETVALDPNEVESGAAADAPDSSVKAGGPELQEELSEALLDADLEDDDSIDFGLSVSDDAPAWQKRIAERMQENALRVSEDSSGFVSTLLQYVPQTMFVLLPLFAMMLKLVFFRRPFHYLQHLVFALHCHSFAYILYLLGVVLALNIEGLGDAWFMLGLAVYLVIAIRRTYGSSWLGAFARAGALYVSYGLVVLLGLSFASLAVLVLM